MEYKRIFKTPFNMMAKAKARLDSNITYTDVFDYTAGGSAIGTIAGTITGMASSVIAPAYAGWQIGDYISDKLDLPGIIEFPVEVITSIATTGFACPIAFLPLTIIGAFSGLVIGATAGTAIGGVKKGLEKICGN